MKPSIYAIPGDYPGQLFIMPKPSGEWLSEDVEHYRSLGVDVIISMLEQDETRALSLHDEGVVCEEKGLAFYNFPIPDRGLPDRDAFKTIVRFVIESLRGGKGVAVHCRAGIGRSGMLVSCALAAFVGSAERAIDVVIQARGVEVPDTQEQRAFIIEIVDELEA